MRKVAVWKGSLSLGLINIPVEIYSTLQSSKTIFTLLHDACKAPIHEIRVCSVCDKKVEWSHIVKGIPLSDNAFFVITPENLKKLRPAKSDHLELIECVDQDQIDPIYLGQSYYLLPTKMTDKAFFLFSTVLKSMQKVAVGEFVMREKQHICMIQPYQNILLITLLQYDANIRKINTSKIKMPSLPHDEKALATHLISMLTVSHFDITQFKDLFIRQLKKKIEQSLKNPKSNPRKITSVRKTDAKNDTLMESLQKSISVHSQKRVTAKKSKKR